MKSNQQGKKKIRVFPYWLCHKDFLRFQQAKYISNIRLSLSLSIPTASWTSLQLEYRKYYECHHPLPFVQSIAMRNATWHRSISKIEFLKCWHNVIMCVLWRNASLSYLICNFNSTKFFLSDHAFLPSQSTSFVASNNVNYTAFAKGSENILPHASWQQSLEKLF